MQIVNMTETTCESFDEHQTGFFTGREHSDVFAYYLTDDEYLEDGEELLDKEAFREWLDAEVNDLW